MDKITDKDTMKIQYNTSDKLSTRISIHSKYSTNKQGFGNWITSHYDIRDGMTVLELGCGTGDMWKGKDELIQKCSRLVLTDLSEGMVSKTKETLGDGARAEYLTADIQDLPFGDNEFDIVIANMMLYHVPDLGKGLSEVRRVLKDGGKFYCATFGENGMMEHIYGLFSDYVKGGHTDSKFTLQNGGASLSEFFTDVKRYMYEDSLAVTDVDDMVDYIFSLTAISDLQDLSRETVRSVLLSNMKDGVLMIPKEYGMFEAAAL